MADVSIRELRNEGGAVIDRVLHGEHLTVTRNGKPVARLHPLSRPAVTVDELIERRRNLGSLNPQRLRDDIDELLDQAL